MLQNEPQDDRQRQQVEHDHRNAQQVRAAERREPVGERAGDLAVVRDLQSHGGEHLAHAEGGYQRVDPEPHHQEAADQSDQTAHQHSAEADQADRDVGVGREPVDQYQRQTHHRADRQVEDAGRERDQEGQRQDRGHHAFAEGETERADRQEQMWLERSEDDDEQREKE